MASINNLVGMTKVATLLNGSGTEVAEHDCHIQNASRVLQAAGSCASFEQ